MKNNVLIFGNGASRTENDVLKFINSFDGDIWGCNKFYTEIFKLPRINLIASVHEEYTTEAIKFKDENNLNYEILTADKFKNYIGYSTGSELINEAILRGYEKIYLVGFDSLNGNNSDIYIKTVVISNFVAQVNELLKIHKFKKEEIQKNIFILQKE